MSFLEQTLNTNQFLTQVQIKFLTETETIIKQVKEQIMLDGKIVFLQSFLVRFDFGLFCDAIVQGWPNCGSCGSEVCENLNICFFYLLQSVEIL